MKKALSLILAVVMTVAMCVSLASCGEDGTYTIGICQQMPHVALDSATQGFKDALIAELGEEKLTFIDQNAQGDPSTCTTIINDFVNKKVDLILANATNALQAAANGTTTIPVLGTSVTAYGEALGIENFDGLVGGNISGTSDLAPFDEQAAIAIDFFPDAQKIGLLYCSAEANSVYQVAEMKKLLEAAGKTCTEFPFADANDLTVVASAAAAASDLIYVPTDNVIANSAEAVNSVVLPTGTPIFGGDQGICGGCGIATISVNYYDIGTATGKMAAQILKGEADISEMPVAFADTVYKVYNKENCEELGVDIAALEEAGFTAIAE